MPGGAEAERIEQRASRCGHSLPSLPPLTEQMMAPDLTASPASLNPSGRLPARPVDNQVLLLAPFLAPSLARSAPIMSI